MYLTQAAHDFIKQLPLKNNFAIDATAGNGIDLLFLAKLVGAKGHVFAFDIQNLAIQRSYHRLKQANLLNRVSLINDNHKNIKQHLPKHTKTKCDAIMFNLGYLPKSEKTINTDKQSTIIALDSALEFLSLNGRMTIIAYKAHQGGMEEYEAVKTWQSYLAKKNYQTKCYSDINNPLSPELICLTKLDTN